MNILEARKVSVKMHDRAVLDGIDLEIKEGGFVTILGPNGAGKTTLLKTMLGLVKKTSGEILLNGGKIRGYGAVRKLSGYMPQRFGYNRNIPMTAREIILNGFAPFKKPFEGINAEEKDRAAQTAGELGVEGLLGRTFCSLSGGEKQKVMLASVLVKKPGLLLLDEPNLNLDPLSYRKFLELIDRIHAAHKISVMFVTHLTASMPYSSADTVVMKKGRITFTGKAEELFGKKDSAEFIYG